MRTISGSLGGRQFDAPKGHRTHPMSDKVRGALFSVLGDISGLTVLDGFAGSGALSFEAISRGAHSATVIDNDKNAQKAISENVAKLGLETKVKLIRANASVWSDNNPNEQFDLVLLDPPYDEIKENLLIKIALHAKLGGIVVISQPPASRFLLPTTTYQLQATKSYGDSVLVFYRRIS